MRQDKSGRLRYAWENHTHGESSVPLSRIVGAKPRRDENPTGVFSGVVSGGGTSRWGNSTTNAGQDYSGYPINSGVTERLDTISYNHIPPNIDLSSPWEIYHRKMSSLLLYRFQGLQTTNTVLRDLHTVRGFTVQYAWGSMSAVGPIQSVFECAAGVSTGGWSLNGDMVAVYKPPNNSNLYWRSRIGTSVVDVPTGLTYQPDVLYWLELTCNNPSGITGVITSQAGDATYTWAPDRCPTGNMGPFLEGDGNQRYSSGPRSSWGWHKMIWTQPW